MRIHTRTICLVLVLDMCPCVARSHEFCLYIKPDKKFLPRLMNATAHQRHTPHWTMSSSSLLPTTCSPSSTSTRSMSSPMYPGASYYMKGRCGGTPHARHVRQHHRRRRPWVRGPQPLRLFICSLEQPPSLLRADLAADQTTKLHSLARSKYGATARGT